MREYIDFKIAMGLLVIAHFFIYLGDRLRDKYIGQ